VLLGRKKRGFGEGYVNGFGGKVEPGETVEAAAAREVRLRGAAAGPEGPCGRKGLPGREAQHPPARARRALGSGGRALLAVAAPARPARARRHRGPPLREPQVLEEAGVVPTSLKRRGVLHFVFDNNPVPWAVHGARPGRRAAGPGRAGARARGRRPRASALPAGGAASAAGPSAPRAPLRRAALPPRAPRGPASVHGAGVQRRARRDGRDAARVVRRADGRHTL
jgi:hypothetical protein